MEIQLNFDSAEIAALSAASGIEIHSKEDLCQAVRMAVERGMEPKNTGMDFKTAKLIELLKLHYKNDISKLNGVLRDAGFTDGQVSEAAISDDAHGKSVVSVTVKTEFAAFAIRNVDNQILMVVGPQCTLFQCENMLREKTEAELFRKVYDADTAFIMQHSVVVTDSGWERVK